MKNKLLSFICSTITCLSLSTLTQASAFTLKSDDISEGQQLSEKHLYNGFGYKGKNLSPHLTWKNIPKGTKSFVITAYDPDAPTGSGWWHWVVFNIPAEVTTLKTGASSQNTIPAGSIQSKTDFGETQFGGAAPPAGAMHRYIFTVYALDVEKLDLNKNASPALVGFLTRKHSLGSAKITAVYTKKAE